MLRWIRRLFVLLLLLAVAAGAQAQAQDTNPSQIDDVVVTGSRIAGGEPGLEALQGDAPGAAE